MTVHRPVGTYVHRAPAVEVTDAQTSGGGDGAETSGPVTDGHTRSVLGRLPRGGSLLSPGRPRTHTQASLSPSSRPGGIRPVPVDRGGVGRALVLRGSRREGHPSAFCPRRSVCPAERAPRAKASEGSESAVGACPAPSPARTVAPSQGHAGNGAEPPEAAGWEQHEQDGRKRKRKQKSGLKSPELRRGRGRGELGGPGLGSRAGSWRGRCREKPPKSSGLSWGQVTARGRVQGGAVAGSALAKPSAWSVDTWICSDTKQSEG